MAPCVGVSTDCLGLSALVDGDARQRQRYGRLHGTAERRNSRHDGRNPERFAHLRNLEARVGRVDRSAVFVYLVAETVEVRVATDSRQEGRHRTQRRAESRFVHAAGLARRLHGVVKRAEYRARRRHRWVEYLRFVKTDLFAGCDSALHVFACPAHLVVGCTRFGLCHDRLGGKGLEQLFEGGRLSKRTGVGVSVQGLGVIRQKALEVVIGAKSFAYPSHSRRSGRREERRRLDRLVFAACDYHTFALPFDIAFDALPFVLEELVDVADGVFALFESLLQSLVDQVGNPLGSYLGLFEGRRQSTRLLPR